MWRDWAKAQEAALEKKVLARDENPSMSGFLDLDCCPRSSYGGINRQPPYVYECKIDHAPASAATATPSNPLLPIEVEIDDDDTPEIVLMKCPTCGPKPWKTAPPLDSRDLVCPNCGRRDLERADG
jgi:hypothetical protein